MRRLAATSKLTLCELNFERLPRLRALFEKSGDVSPRTLLPQIGTLLETDINAGQTLLFFDEIQECPQAITFLRYLYEDTPACENKTSQVPEAIHEALREGPPRVLYRGWNAGEVLSNSFSFVGKQGGQLFYWKRHAHGSSAKVDYLLSRVGKIIPVEVKSGASGVCRILCNRSGLKFQVEWHSVNKHDLRLARILLSPVLLATN